MRKINIYKLITYAVALVPAFGLVGMWYDTRDRDEEIYIERYDELMRMPYSMETVDSIGCRVYGTDGMLICNAISEYMTNCGRAATDTIYFGKYKESGTAYISYAFSLASENLTLQWHVKKNEDSISVCSAEKAGIPRAMRMLNTPLGYHGVPEDSMIFGDERWYTLAGVIIDNDTIRRAMYFSELKITCYN